MTLDNQGVIKIKVSLTSVAEEEDRLRARVLCQQVADTHRRQRIGER